MKLMKFSVINVVGQFKYETPENFWIDGFVVLRSKAFFKCNDKNTSKLKGIPKSQQKLIVLRENINVYLEENIEKNVIFILFDLLILICSFKMQKILHYLHLMTKDVMKVLLKVTFRNKH